MTLREAALRYADVLLSRIKIAGFGRRWDEVNDLCDRFERLMANLPPVPQPIVWDGDYA